MLFLNEDTQYMEGGFSSSAAKYLDQLSEEMGYSAEDFDVFGEDAFGGMSLVLEMETAWNALEKDMIVVEHNSIVNEDVEVLTEGLKEWGKAIKDFFIKLWNGVKARFQKVMDWISSKFMNAEKWFKKNESSMEEKEIKILSYVGDGSCLEKAINYGKYEIIGKSETKDDIEEKVKKILEALKEEDVLGKETTKKIKPSDLGKVIKGSNKAKGAVKKANATIGASIQGGIEKAKRIQAGASSDDEKTEAKKGVEVAKARSSALSKMEAKQVSLFKKALSEAVSGCRKLMTKKEDN